MNLNENNYTKEIFNTFVYFIESYETQLKCTVDDIKEQFKAAFFVEKTIIKMEEKLCVQQFVECFNCWLESDYNKIPVVYEIDLYKIACDKLLSRYFKAENKNDTDIAIRMYTSLCGEKRFEIVIENVILRSGINESILNYCTLNKDRININMLKSRLLLFNFMRCNYEDVEKNIENLIDTCHVKNHLSILLEILTSDFENTTCTAIKRSILQILLNKMEDRTFTTGIFWNALIKNVDKKLLVTTCEAHDEFFKSLFNFLVYCGCMMDYKKINAKRIWFVSKTKTICPEICFTDIFTVINLLLCTKGDIAECTSNRIEEAIEVTKSLFWADIEKLCL